MLLSRGATIDRYVVEDALGAGGMGEVYKARDTRLKRFVALKILRAQAGSADPAAQTDGAARMLREARAAAAFDHPNVVAIFDVGQISEPGELQGTTYLAMELIKGRSVRAVVGDASIPVSERISWLTDVAKALAAAHRAGIVHRDVKPENVMVREDGVVKVLDFGIARRAQAAPADTSSIEGQVLPSMTTAGVVMGTPLYMAPEQLRAEPLDGRADQFSWGVLAYELLTGAAPWSMDGGAISVVAQILSSTPAPLSATGAVPPVVAATIERAMQKDRDARFPSMDALIDALTGKVDAARAPSVDPGRSALGAAATERAPAATRDEPAASPDGPSVTTTAPGAVARAKRARRRLLLGFGAATVALGAVGVAALWPPRGATERAPSTAPTGECGGHRACIDAHGGAPWACNFATRKCVALATDDCVAKIETKEMRADDTVWLGAILPLSGPLGIAWGKVGGDVLDLARRDFAGVGGIPGVRDGEMRPLGLLLCDGTKNPAAAAAHLMDVGTPAVLVGLSLGDAIELSRTTFFPNRAVVFDMLNQSPLVTKMPQPANTPRLVWRLAASAALSGEALAHVISDHVDAALRAPRGPLAKGGATKLAIVRSDASFAASVLDATTSTVRLNGRGLVENNGLFKQLTFSRGDAPAKVEQLVAELVAFAPHVVAYADGKAFEETYIASIERSWTAPYRPYFVSATTPSTPWLLAFVGTSTERRRRFLGVDLPANTDENFRFVNHFNATYGDKLTPATAPGVIFDAFYVAAYAATASRAAHVSGLDVATGMARLGGDAPAVSVGASSIFAAYEILRQGKMLRLTGAGTQLDFDQATGEIPNDLAVYCMSVDLKGQAGDPVESGLRYDHRAKALVGKLDCP